MSRWCLAVPIPGELGEAIDALRHRLDPGRVHMPAHITLVAPWSGGDIAAQMGAIVEVCASADPWPVHLHGGGTFRPRNPTEFIAVHEGREGLELLHERLMHTVSHERQGRSFHPHVTVATRCSDDVLDRAKQCAAEFDAWFTASSITLFTWMPDAVPPQWKSAQNLQLG